MAKVRYNNMALPNGTFLGKGKYIIYKKISSGGYGSVYLAKDNERNVFCAIKEFLPTTVNCRPTEKNLNLSFDNNDEKDKFYVNLKSFYYEAEIVSKFNHPNIIKIFDVFEEYNTAYIVMPLEKGMSLFNAVHFHNKETNNRFSDFEIKNIFIQICSGIEFLHKNNFLHLDIKPSNVWLRPDGSIVVLDLGSSRDIDKYQEQTTPAFTPGYAPPEQYQNIKDGKIDERTDIYAIGGALKFCLEITPPIISIERKANENFYINERLSQANQQLLNIVDKSMQLKPENRYQTVGELKKAFEDIKYLSNQNEFKKYSRNFLLLPTERF